MQIETKEGSGALMAMKEYEDEFPILSFVYCPLCECLVNERICVESCPRYRGECQHAASKSK